MPEDLVYSTEKGDLRNKSKNNNRKSNNKTPIHSGIKNDGIIRIQKEKKGRAGKTVTVIYNIPLNNFDMSVLAKKIKQICGAGGSVKGDVIIIQGENMENVIVFLEGEGYKVKRSGG